jgi:hypothetical protein
MPEKMPAGLASRVAVSIVVVVGWLVFLVIFLGFYAQGIHVYRILAIILASILVVGAILAPMWTYWGMKYGWKWENPPRRRPRQRK